MREVVKKSFSDTEGGRVNKHYKQLKSRKKRNKPSLTRSLSESAMEERERERLKRTKERLRAKSGSLVTPYNTPFLLGSQDTDHQDPDPESFYCQNERKLEDFLGAEFRKEYDLQLYNRLENMSKERLMSEYFSQERKIEQLEQRISESERREREAANYSQQSEAEQFDMINVFQLIQRLANEFNILKAENDKLLGENSALSHKLYSIPA